MAPAALSDAPSAGNANGADGVVVEETHLQDPMRAGEGALPDEPDKENVLGRHEGSDAAGGTLAQYTIPDDLFDDDGDEDGDHDFAPRGGHTHPSAGAPGSPPRPARKPTNGASQPAADKTTEKSKDGKAQKKDTKVQKKDAKAQKKDAKTSK